MVKLHRKTRNITERYFRIGEPQAPKIEPANLKLCAMSFRNGRILTVKCQTTREPILGGSVTINGLDSAQAQMVERQLSVPGATITVRLAP